MLNVYTDMDCFPSGKTFIFDCDKTMGRYRLRDNEWTRTVLREIEKGEYYNGELFKNRFGGLAEKSYLSTTSKILLQVFYDTDKIWNGVEVGGNGLDLLMRLTRGNIYFNDPWIYLDFYEGVEYSVNGNVSSSHSELVELLEGRFVCLI